MMHKVREEFQATLKHGLFYTGRFLMQAVSNFWQTVKGQQIIQLSVCALVSLGYNIHLGIIEFDKAALNVQSVMYFCGTLFILVIIFSLVTAPFHLDRERDEKIQEKDGKITELQFTIKTHNTLQIGKAENKPQPKPRVSKSSVDLINTK